MCIKPSFYNRYSWHVMSTLISSFCFREELWVGIPFCEVTYARWARLGHHASIGKKFPDGSKSSLHRAKCIPNCAQQNLECKKQTGTSTFVHFMMNTVSVLEDLKSLSIRPLYMITFHTVCYDQSSLMKNHWHKALLLVTWTITFHWRATTVVKIPN